MTIEEIDALAKEIDINPGAREAQRRLAQEVTKFVHGQAAVDAAEQLSRSLFSGDVATLSAAQIADAFGGVPSFDITAESKNIIDFLVDGGVEQSKRQAREDVNNGAITINGEKVTDLATEIVPATHYDGKFVLVRRGKKKYFLGKVQ